MIYPLIVYNHTIIFCYKMSAVVVKTEPNSEDESSDVMDVDAPEVIETKIVNNHVNDVSRYRE